MVFTPQQWGLVLGGSSGFGLATAAKLAASGMSIAIVHRDRKGAMPAIEQRFAEIRAKGARLVAFNLDATTAAGRAEVLAALPAHLGERGRVRVLLHSIAFGNLKLIAPFPSSHGPGPGPAPGPGERGRARLAHALDVTAEKLSAAIEAAAVESDALADLAWEPKYDSELLLEEEDYSRTIEAMGTSIVAWAQGLLRAGLFADDARVLGLTSEGSEIAWRGYAAVSAAKAALEAVVRAMALELAPYGIRSNVIQPGISDTPALRAIPGSQRMKATARRRNPFGRLTTPEDVADVVCLLCTDEARWINGAVIRADGGEHIVG
jgi:NAD(P)-dependent dehydrogenase (short-subunit alcohol dehydrogenase family)